jgi:hypothetical protein
MGPLGLFAQRLVESVDPFEYRVEVVKMLLQITQPADPARVRRLVGLSAAP